MSGSVFRVKGNIRAVTKILTDGGVDMRKIKAEENSVVFTAYGKNAYLAVKLLSSSGRTFEILKDGRQKEYLKKNLIRIGLYLGVILGVLCAVFYSRAVTRVEISGNKVISTETVLEKIKEKTDLPIDKKSVEVDGIKKSVISIDGVSSASVYIKGNVLKVEILEEPPYPSVLDPTDFTDIVSNYDGIITRITAYSGTPLVKRGDTVKKGQPLISCDVETADGITYKENALGDVYARVWVTVSKIFTPTVMVTARTGRTEKMVKLLTPYVGGPTDFSSYETEIRQVGTGGAAPIYYETIFYETEEREAPFDFFADEENIVKEELEKIENGIDTDAEFLRSWYDVKRLDKNVRLDIYYEIEVKINEERT